MAWHPVIHKTTPKLLAALNSLCHSKRLSPGLSAMQSTLVIWAAAMPSSNKIDDQPKLKSIKCLCVTVLHMTIWWVVWHTIETGTMTCRCRALHWRYNDHDDVSNHQPHTCLLNRLFRRRSKETPKLSVAGLCLGNHWDQRISRTKGQLRRKCFHLMTSSWVRGGGCGPGVGGFGGESKPSSLYGPKTKHMITSSNGNISRVTGPLCGEFTGHRWIPTTKASNTELWCFLWCTPEQMVE